MNLNLLLLFMSLKNCENNLKENSKEIVKVEKATKEKEVKRGRQAAIKKDEDENEYTPTSTPVKKRKGRKATAWSSRRRKTRKKIIEEEPDDEGK